MKHLFNPTDTAAIVKRLEKLASNSSRQWGKMTVNQMLAHCNASLETAMGLNQPESIGFIGRFFGRLVKRSFFSEQPFKKNSPTAKLYIISGNPDFAGEKAKLIQQIHQFAHAGPSHCNQQPHVFFGPLTPHEWAAMQWKHIDHHLQQFSC